MSEGGDSYPCPTFKVPTSKPKGREYSFYIPSVLVIDPNRVYFSSRIFLSNQLNSIEEP